MSFQDISAGALAGLNGPRLGTIIQIGPDSGPDASQAVASGVFQINTAVNTFKKLVSTLGTGKDTPELREKLHKSRQYISQLVKETAAKLKDAASRDDEDVAMTASKKASDAKLAKDFEFVLKEFQKAQRVAAERETTYAPVAVQLTMTQQSSRSGSRGYTGATNGESSSLLQEQQRQQYLSVDNELAYNEAVIEEREQSIREIQQQIGEVHEIFKDLAVLVKEQGGAIDDIEASIEGTHRNTVQANKQLLSAVARQHSANNLTCWLLSIFAVALLIFFLVMAS